MENSAIQKISSVKIEDEDLIIYTGQQSYKFKISDVSKRLSQASEIEKTNFQISPSRYGIHWPQIDEDISLNGLLRNKK